MIAYIALYDDQMYPEDNEILGGRWSQAEAQVLIDERLEMYKSDRDSGLRLADPSYYRIDQIEMPEIL